MAGLDLSIPNQYIQQQQRPDLGHKAENDNNNNNNINNRDCNTLDRVNEADNGTEDGTGDVFGRRPRGRPAGSKNKPKPPVIITRESANTLRAHILEVGSGCDIFECVANYARRRQRGICVLNGTGMVNNVTLRQPLSVSGGQHGVMTIDGQYEILSLSGSFLPPPAPPGATSLTILLSGGPGQVIGGNVVGELIAACPVIIMAASFTNVAYERLPLEEDDEAVQMRNIGGVAEFSDQGSGLPFLNLPMNMQNCQVPVDRWANNNNNNPNNNSGRRPSFG